MISIGRGIRVQNKYTDEVDFCVKHGFQFMQVWFRNGEILIDADEPKEAYIKNIGFPVILHAVFDPIDFELYGDRLLEITEYIGNSDVIIHPVCKKSPVDENTEYQLAKQVKLFSQKAKARGITWYLENNSVIDEFHYSKQDLHVVYDSDDYVEQLLDVAHIDNYEHLAEIVSVRFPKCLHVAGKHFDVPHEHLPLTQGDIDYTLIFQKYLNGYDGRIILEVNSSDEDILVSKKIIEDAVNYALKKDI